MYRKDDKVYVEWFDIDDFIKNLKNVSEKENLKFSGVYGVPRGGLVIATMISYKLDIPLLLAPSPNCIIVDDIADSGRTLIHYRPNDTQFNKYYIATLYYHERSLVKPDYYEYTKGND